MFLPVVDSFLQRCPNICLFIKIRSPIIATTKICWFSLPPDKNTQRMEQVSLLAGFLSLCPGSVPEQPWDLWWVTAPPGLSSSLHLQTSLELALSLPQPLPYSFLQSCALELSLAVPSPQLCLRCTGILFSVKWWAILVILVILPSLKKKKILCFCGLILCVQSRCRFCCLFSTSGRTDRWLCKIFRQLGNYLALSCKNT